MPWHRSPVKLFGYTGLLLFLLRVVFPPADFAGALQARTHLYLFDFRLDLTGFGMSEVEGLESFFSLPLVTI